MRRLTRSSGLLLIATGVLHVLLGVLLGAEPLADIAQDGLFNAVDPYVDRSLVFWFLMSGVLIIMLGQLVRWAQRQSGTLPAFLGWQLLAVSVVGVFLMPISGFWILIPQAFLVLAADGSRPTAPTVD